MKAPVIRGFSVRHEYPDLLGAVAEFLELILIKPIWEFFRLFLAHNGGLLSVGQSVNEMRVAGESVADQLPVVAHFVAGV